MKKWVFVVCLGWSWVFSSNSVEPDTQPPRILAVLPPPGSMEQLTAVSVTFNEAVVGVRADDLCLGSRAATGVTGSGASYTFNFAQPEPGPVELRWDADTLITDAASPPNRFDPLAAGTWQYDVIDRTAPVLVEVAPRAGLKVRSLTQVEVRFSELVIGLDAADLLANGIAATNVAGESAGPYRFQFASPAAGQVRISWAPNHGIRDAANPANPFIAGEWTVELDPNYAAPNLRINEFLASSVAGAGLKDEDGELQDWIEIYNDGLNTVNLEGWSLTDDREDPGRWVFPAVSLPPGRFLVVFASGKDRKPVGPGAKLHANFKLNPTGEYLALLNPESPRQVVSGFDPSFPEQRNDYSFGYDAARRLRYFRTPTPGAANGASSVEGVVPPPHVNVAHGWFDSPFTLFVTSSLDGVTMRYATDGSEPTETNGRTYSEPIPIATTTTIRVAGFKANMLPSTITTQTYLFADDILRQPNNPQGYPTGGTVWAGYPSDFEMDPEIVSNPSYSGILKDALLALPAMSIVCRKDDLFSAANGIYTHPTSRGPAWERPCSVEFIPLDGTAGFQANAGVQIQGNAAREPQKQPKHPFRLVFKGDYGSRRLEFPLFPDSPISSFDTLVLRADFNYSWLHWNPNQRIKGQRTRDAWMKDTMRAMGGLASHNRYVHLFINGLYWGIYDPSERPDGAFAASYLGGEKEHYDVMNEGAAVDGDNRAYNAMLAISNLASASAYGRMQQYLDIPQFIDYMLLHFYVGHQDWGQNKNWYTVRPKDGRSGFMYVPWDGEMVLDGLNDNRVSNADTPSGLHTKLVANPEYRLAFADCARKHLFRDGVLTPASAQARWRSRAKEIELAIVAESARWGDYRRDVHPYQTGPYQLYTRDNQWRTEQNRLLNQYFPQRTSILLAQLRSANLYPAVAAPDLNRFGGQVQRGFALTMSAPEGTIYFTADGSDPRVPNTGAVSAAARSYGGPASLTQSVRIKARALHQGIWSALTEADFKIAEIGLPLRITEIMYHPIDGDAFEFLEVQNLGSVALDVTGFSFTGVAYVFPYRSVVNPGGIMTLASSLSPSSFAAQYPGVAVAGYFVGALSNGSERIELRDREGRTVTSVTYADQGAWPERADGQGYSLEVMDPHGDPNDPANWIPSAALGGSPGQRLATGPIRPTGPILLNEIQASPPSASDASDWIEISNSGDTPASLAGWTVTDHGTTPFVFPAGTVIPPHGFLLVSCDGDTNLVGFHTAFKLDQDGETVALYDPSRQRVDATTFGQQAPGFALGRVSGNNDWQITNPTPGSPNTAAELASISGIKINEWMANPRPGDDDWLELFNPDNARPAALKGLALATENALYELPAHSFIPPGGFIRLVADERSGAAHVGFKLPAVSGSITLLDALGYSLDRVVYTTQAEGVAEGRLPDGGASISRFAGGGTPGQSNTSSERARVVVNEVLASTGTAAGWVELFNPQGTATELSGFAISLERDGGKSWEFPAGARIGAGEYLKVEFDSTHPASTTIAEGMQSGRSLNTSGGGIYLRDPLGRVIDSVEYGFSVAGQPIGRSGSEWKLLAAATPGKPNAAAAELGPANALRLNEWLAAPAEGDDWFELFNPDTRPVSLAGLYLTDDPALGNRRKFQLSPRSFIGPNGWVALVADSAPNKGTDHVNFSLDPLGEALRLYGADGTLIDAIDFGLQRTGLPEGRLVDGGAEIGPLTVGPTPGRSNTPPSRERDTDGDGLTDEWEIANGTNPGVRDADVDSDHDGLTNGQEYAAGTDPNHPASSLSVTRVVVDSSITTLEFMAMSNRTYSVLQAPSVNGAAWTKLIDVTALPTNRLERATDSNPRTAARFYRLVTPAQP